MNELCEKLLVAHRSGSLLQTSIESSYGAEENKLSVIQMLVVLHNEGHVDLIKQFESLRNKQDSGPDYSLARHLFEKALPALNATVQNVMECVAHLAREAGQDMAANWIFKSFIDYCVADPSRPEQGIDIINKSPEKWMDFVAPVIVAGTRIDLERFFVITIRLSSHENIDIRKRAIFSLGQIQYAENHELLKKALDRIEESVADEEDDHLLGNAVKSICSVCMTDRQLVEQGVKVLEMSLSKGRDYTLHAAAEAFELEINKLPETLLESMMRHLHSVNPDNKGTVDMIDFGVAALLERSNSTQGIEFLESFLLAHSQQLT